MKFIFDLDGTICFKGKPLSDKITQSLLELSDNGHDVVFASARPIRDMLPVLPACFHQHSLIGANGALLSQNGSITNIGAFTKDQQSSLLALIEEYQASYLIDGDWNYAYTGTSDHPITNNIDTFGLAEKVSAQELERFIKVLILTANNMEQLAEKLSALQVVLHRHNKEGVLDISPQHINKWNALIALGIQKNEYIAFGNDANDISMFENALHSVMIGMHEELVSHASEAIDLNDNVEEAILFKIQECACRSMHGHRQSCA